jgi:hypothetical protein
VVYVERRTALRGARSADGRNQDGRVVILRASRRRRVVMRGALLLDTQAEAPSLPDREFMLHLLIETCVHRRVAGDFRDVVLPFQGFTPISTRR